jgi:hypothetical protein
MSEFISTTGMSFRTIDNPNYQAAIYALSIRGPGELRSEYLTYTFPMSPESLRKEWTAMTAVYDTQGQPFQGGVDREVDMFGQAPPVFTIEGSTGNKRHQTDGYLFTGLASVQAVELLFAKFARLNQTQIAQQAPLYTLEFYDYFRNDYWQVAPEGPQGLYQSKDRPLYVNYRFRLVAIKKVSAPITGVLDALANVFGGSATATAANVANNLNIFATLYTGSGLTDFIAGNNVPSFSIADP